MFAHYYKGLFEFPIFKQVFATAWEEAHKAKYCNWQKKSPIKNGTSSRLRCMTCLSNHRGMHFTDMEIKTPLLHPLYTHIKHFAVLVMYM